VTKEYRQLVKRAQKNGWTLRKAGSGHWTISKDGVHISIPDTPGRWSTYRNTMSLMRKAGAL
jgi:hypothetical protein